MKRRLLKSHVSHQAVTSALKQFLENGGIIVRLPEQKNQQKPVVGGEKYENYESLASILTI